MCSDGDVYGWDGVSVNVSVNCVVWVGVEWDIVYEMMVANMYMLTCTQHYS